MAKKKNIENGKTVGERTYQKWARCTICNVKLIQQRVWKSMSPGQRTAKASAGFARQGVGPKCVKCSH